MHQRIWLIGGTTESKLLADAIAQLHLPCIISIATEAARTLYPILPSLQVWVGRLDLSQIVTFLHEEKIVAVLDASHPYAVEVSRNAIAACSQLQIPYLRYERQRLPGDKETITLDSFEALVAGDYLAKQRVLLTVGYKALPLFQPWQEKSTLFARILPATISLEAALAAGFTPDRLFAMRPPISANLEKALWKHWQISMVVTKASGVPGGEDIKRKVAEELGVTLVLIKPPAVDYPQVTNDVSEVMSFCKDVLLRSN